MRAFEPSRRGRPKRAVANDDACGTTPAVQDGGTAELQLKRAQLARGLDPVLCAHPLDLLAARGWIAPSEQRAGWRYAGLYRRVNGRVTVSYGRFYAGFSGGGGGLPAADLDEADLARLEQLYRRAKADLLAAGNRVARMTEAVSVFAVWPGFVFSREGARSTACQRLRLGLAALGDSFAGPRR
ncbi:hypothetical protein A8950_2323 [Dongia mobilis]|uniref:Uncharacterized protein n=1 Tax=Dongia mobilis TaxID=578943 RepID=A0A4R6WUA9_9PROT|nr:hypothetical protein [Dongia mobilis]TDQ82500.1 hypothetical protein A8950_2323 [Dongia mobilis]